MTPRQLAFSLLQRAEKNEQFLNIALDHALQNENWEEADRALASALIYGVVERKLTLDYQINRLSSRPSDRLDEAVKTALRIGLYQLIYLTRIPVYAAIHETVALLPQKSAGFVNAVLRSFSRNPQVVLPSRSENPADYLSVAYSVGLPLCRTLIDIYGEQQTEAVLHGFEQTKKTTLSVNTLRIERSELARHFSDAVPTEYAPNGLSVGGSIRNLYGFQEGLFFVQDEASQLCVEALGAESGDTVMDICSCPGSKSFGSAVRMNNRGQIFAFDLHPKKLSLVESSARRLGITIIKTAAHDGRIFLPEMEQRADRVLCDVPCSGFGVLGKKPEIRYKDPDDFRTLPEIQLAILETACRYVRPGGVLVYSTCTILPQENEENVGRFLQKHPEFSLLPFSVGQLTFDRGMKTLFPNEYATDGFFIAKMIRT